jgi:hypothetical protein
MRGGGADEDVIGPSTAKDGAHQITKTVSEIKETKVRNWMKRIYPTMVEL